MERKQGKKRRRVWTLTTAKILLDDEKSQLFEYLQGRCRGKFNKLLYPKTLVNRRRLLICDVLISTGLRCSELCDLRLQDTPFVLGRNVIIVYRGKNDLDREVPVSERLAAAITEYIKKYRGRTMPRHIRRSDISKPLFYSQRMKPFTPSGIYKFVQKTADEAGLIKKVTPHMFRHTFATNLARQGAGIQLEDIKGLMGHSSLSITEKYLHFARQFSDDMGQKIDRAIGQFCE